MKLPYFLWNLKYNTVSFPLEDAEEELHHELTGLIAVKNSLMEIVRSYELTEKHACKYKNDSNSIHLKNIEDNNKLIQYNLYKLYMEMELLNKHNFLTEEEFLAGEAEKKVINSTFFNALNNLVNLKSQKLISEEELWKYIDELRDLIYDFQEKDLKELAGKVEKSSYGGLLHRFATFIEKGLCEIDEGLAVIERAFEENKFSQAEKGLLKAREGYMKIKTVEIIGEGELL